MMAPFRAPDQEAEARAVHREHVTERRADHSFSLDPLAEQGSIPLGDCALGSAPMPAHDVTMNLSHPITVLNVDVEFEVRSDGELMGKVQISRGGIDWMPFKSHPRTASWEQFAGWMEGTL